MLSKKERYKTDPEFRRKQIEYAQWQHEKSLKDPLYRQYRRMVVKVWNTQQSITLYQEKLRRAKDKLRKQKVRLENIRRQKRAS